MVTKITQYLQVEVSVRGQVTSGNKSFSCFFALGGPKWNNTPPLRGPSLIKKIKNVFDFLRGREKMRVSLFHLRTSGKLM